MSKTPKIHLQLLQQRLEPKSNQPNGRLKSSLRIGFTRFSLNITEWKGQQLTLGRNHDLLPAEGSSMRCANTWNRIAKGYEAKRNSISFSIILNRKINIYMTGKLRT